MSLKKSLDRMKSDYMLESHRVESFKKWPYNENEKCSITKMAEAGFYWSGTDSEPDTATCFVCKKTLDGWESSDDPWKEHMKHAPQCVFVKIGNKESLLTMEDFLEIFQTVLKNRISSSVDQQKKQLETLGNDERSKFLTKK